MDLLKGLFYQHYCQSKEHIQLGEMADVREADKVFTEWAKQLNRKDFLEIEEIVSRVASTNEMQGFCYGFRYAMRLMGECKGGPLYE